MKPMIAFSCETPLKGVTLEEYEALALCLTEHGGTTPAPGLVPPGKRVDGSCLCWAGRGRTGDLTLALGDGLPGPSALPLEFRRLLARVLKRLRRPQWRITYGAVGNPRIPGSCFGGVLAFTQTARVVKAKGRELPRYLGGRL